jgi:hypothetical protein
MIYPGYQIRGLPVSWDCFREFTVILLDTNIPQFRKAIITI